MMISTKEKLKNNKQMLIMENYQLKILEYVLNDLLRL